MGTHSDVDYAWAAGLFEGEGSVMISPKDIPCLSLAMSDEDVVRRFADIVGRGRINGPYQYGKGKPMWYWKVTGLEATFEVGQKIWHLLGERRRTRYAECLASYYLSDKQRIPGRRAKTAN
jgi:hypothetical protein